ncbi:hypothetical protein EB796_010152 [Bugula neritina]|uniref:G-protein coupled receptors family 1 profile domain-containing protein n=1 Tax=Bugula neritina TaxID=10212 RepID=A0A7J7JYN6_BUGNE|nr:hypothetical protein EB796_010152 [Bugula neritina]
MLRMSVDESTQFPDSSYYQYYNESGNNMTAVLLPYEYFSEYTFEEYGEVLAVTDTELKKLSPAMISYIVIFLLGAVGNSLVIYCVAKYKRMKSNTNQLLLSLACADLMVVLICIPVKFAKLFSYGWVFGPIMCKLTHYIQTWSMVTSVMTLTAISVERYYAISQPLRAKSVCTTNHARAVILSIWIFASALSLPVIFVQNYHAIGLITPIYSCDKSYVNDREKELLVQGYEMYMMALMFVVPVIVMLCTYIGVCVQLWAATDRITKISEPSTPENGSPKLQTCVSRQESRATNESVYKMSRQVHNSKEAKIRWQVLKMLFVVVIIFILCWCPLLTYNIIVAVGLVKPYVPHQYPYATHLNRAFSLLAYANSCLNPIVYGFMSRYFRKSFKQALSSCCLLRRSRYRSCRSKKYTDRSSSSLRRYGDVGCGTDAAKRNTITTLAADSTLSRSPPVSPNGTYSAK